MYLENHTNKFFYKCPKEADKKKVQNILTFLVSSSRLFPVNVTIFLLFHFTHTCKAY